MQKDHQRRRGLKKTQASSTDTVAFVRFMTEWLPDMATDCCIFIIAGLSKTKKLTLHHRSRYLLSSVLLVFLNSSPQHRETSRGAIVPVLRRHLGCTFPSVKGGNFRASSPAPADDPYVHTEAGLNLGLTFRGRRVEVASKVEAAEEAVGLK